jgi:two-component system, OmpR family, sensor kinase
VSTVEVVVHHAFLLRRHVPLPLLEHVERGADVRRGRAVAKLCADCLGRLVDDLLNLARLDARETPRRETVDLTDLTGAAVAATAAAHEASTSRLEVVAAGPVMASGDPDALLRAIRNLLDNALAVADMVVIETTQTTHGSAISITDNRPGIPAHERERIFEPFVRLPTSPSGGTGLGLAIVQQTIASHGGTIICEPSPCGGARFTLRLPPARQEATAAGATPRPRSRPAET